MSHEEGSEIHSSVTYISCLLLRRVVVSRKTSTRQSVVDNLKPQPGHPISEVLGRFGKPYQQTDDVRDMGDGGAPVDHAFCNGKTLYQYYVSPPCRWVNIYTDRDGNIVFVNWSSS